MLKVGAVIDWHDAIERYRDATVAYLKQEICQIQTEREEDGAFPVSKHRRLGEAYTDLACLEGIDLHVPPENVLDTVSNLMAEWEVKPVNLLFRTLTNVSKLVVVDE